MNKPLILVVEDDAPVRNLITTTLKAHDYHYLTAATGESAILEATSHNPDVIFLDLGLPDMDGVEIIKRIRTWSNIPIIVISARSEDTDKIEALDAGADDYLTKPFSVEELLAQVLSGMVTDATIPVMATSDSEMLNQFYESMATQIKYAGTNAQVTDIVDSHYTLQTIQTTGTGDVHGTLAEPPVITVTAYDLYSKAETNDYDLIYNGLIN